MEPERRLKCGHDRGRPLGRPVCGACLLQSDKSRGLGQSPIQCVPLLRKAAQGLAAFLSAREARSAGPCHRFATLTRPAFDSSSPLTNREWLNPKRCRMGKTACTPDRWASRKDSKRYCFSFSHQLNGLTKMTNSPGVAEAVGLPQVF